MIASSGCVRVILSSCGSAEKMLLTAASLRDQIYPHWVLEIEASTFTAKTLTSIEFIVGSERLRARSSPATDRDEQSSWIIPLLPGDELSADALAEFILTVKEGGRDIVYADHVEIFGTGNREDIFFKPNWSPELLLATDYIGRAFASGSAVAAITKLPMNFDEVDLWALWLDLTSDGTRRINHIERPLIRLRTHDETTATMLSARAESVVRSALHRRGISGEPFRSEWAVRLGVLVYDVEFADDGPSVAILIPTKNNWRILKRCFESLKTTAYKNYTITIIDNASDDPVTKEYLSTVDADVLLVPSPPGGFNYSYVNNVAAAQVNADFLLFLNDDTEVISSRWLSQMVGWLQVSGVASVGARLIFPSGLLQHAGITHELLDGVLPAPTFKLIPSTTLATRGLDRTVHNAAAMTAACMLTPRELFLQSGGFNETEFGVAYNDCDYGFRLSREGFRHVFTPSAELLHHEGASRGRGARNDRVSEEVNFIVKYRDWRDPYLNKNIARSRLDLSAGVRAASTGGDANSAPTVCLISHNLNYEGAPLVLADVALGLRQAGCRVFVLCLTNGLLRTKLESGGVEVMLFPELDVYNARAPGQLETVLQPLVSLLNQEAVDVVIANTVLTHWGIVAASLARLASIWIIHESEPPFSHLDGWGGEHVGHAQRAFRETYVNVFVAHATRELYLGYERPEKSLVIYNGCDASEIKQLVACEDRERARRDLGFGDDDVVFITPGTVCERKAQIDLVQALSLLPQRILRKSGFVIVGDRPGDYSTRLHARVAQLGALGKSRVRIIPETPNVWSYYAAADGLAFASHLESFPRVILEGMACGLAIVTTPTFGISEQLRDNDTALFFNVGDSRAFARCIERVVDDRKLKQKLGSNAAASLSRFPTVARMQQQYVEIVREAALVGQPRGAALVDWFVADGPASWREQWQR